MRFSHLPFLFLLVVSGAALRASVVSGKTPSHSPLPTSHSLLPTHPTPHTPPPAPHSPLPTPHSPLPTPYYPALQQACAPRHSATWGGSNQRHFAASRYPGAN